MTSIPSYERDSYQTRLQVQILDLGEADGRHYAVLDDTVCYPEGGGQPADHGQIGDVAVLDVQRTEGVIRHFLEARVALGPALLTLDWGRRYDHMQQHTAQHLLSALALERFGWATRSFHLGAETSDIELDASELSAADLTTLEAAAAAEIVAARPVTTRRVTAEEYRSLDVRSRGLPAGHSGEIRLVEIEGIDLNTCGGTHLRSTAEIEVLKIVGTERLRGGTRVRWAAGKRVRSRLQRHEERNARLRELLDSDDDGLPETASLKLDQLAEARRRIRQLKNELARARVESLADAEEDVVVAHFENAGGSFLQPIGRALLERAPAKTFLLTARNEKGSFFLLATSPGGSIDTGTTGPRIADLLQGKGGGSGGIFQGKAGSLSRVEEAAALLR